LSESMKSREYLTVGKVSGPLIIVEGVKGVAYGEVVEIVTPSGETKRGQVLDAYEDRAVIQVYEGTSGIDTMQTRVRFTGETIKLGVGLSCSVGYSAVKGCRSTADLNPYAKTNWMSMDRQ
jgi:V/A-type H+-transporting ATPase subunit B